MDKYVNLLDEINLNDLEESLDLNEATPLNKTSISLPDLTDEEKG